MVSHDEFADLVKDALANLYDPVHLQTHPLAGLLALPHTSWGTVGESLRTLLRETVASLKPPASVPITRPEWAGYRVLWLRYVRLNSEAAVCKELNVSEATLFRRQREALDAVTSILWQRYEQAEEARAAPAEGLRAPLSAGEARARAAHLASAGPPQPLDLVEFFDGIRKTILPLAEQQGVMLRMDLPPCLPTVYAEPALLRQIILTVLADGIRLWPGTILQFAVRLKDAEMVCRLQGLPRSAGPAAGLAAEANFAQSRHLLSLCHGRLWIEGDSPESPALAFTTPVTRPRLILVVDDDPATIGLYRRYLQGSQCAVTEAHTAEQAEALSLADRPDLVLLDVMMPQQDGWTLLRTLKARPETASIPVIVCSVIDQPDLARALGAAAVLSKPISPEQLLQAIQAQWDREDRMG